jgi:hypothetical protein
LEATVVLRELGKQAIQIAVLYFVMDYYWGTEQWFKDKIKELLFFLGMGIVFFITSMLFHLVTRPVTITISQENSRFSLQQTNLSIQKRSKTQEHERTVNLSLKVTRKFSFWGFLVAKILKRKDITILVEPVTQGIVLQVRKEALRQDIIATSSGFHIKVGEYLERILSRSSSGEYSKGCEYVILEDNLHPVTSETFQIVPILLSRGQPAPTWIGLILNFKTDQHTVLFKRE